MATIAQKLALLGGNVDASGEVDSNTIDGLDSLQFLRSDQSDTIDGSLSVNGRLNAGQTAGEYAQFGRDSGSHAFIDAVGEGTPFRIYTKATGGSSSAKLSLLADGNLGIGTTSPATKLELNDSSGYTGTEFLTLSRAEHTRYRAQIGFGDYATGNKFGLSFTTRNDNVDYQTMVMVDGKVGVGTNNPQEKVHIADSADATLLLDNTGTSGDCTIKLSSANRSGYAYISSGPRGGAVTDCDLRFGEIDEGDAMIINAGRVGIGQSSPSQKLHVGDGTDADKGIISVEGSGGQHLLFSESSTHVDGASLALRPASGQNFTIQADGSSSSVFKIDTSGNIRAPGMIYSHLSNTDGRYVPVYKGSATTTDNNYLCVARISGGNGYSSSCEFAFSGTTGNTVFGVYGVASANHSLDGSITTWINSNYSASKIKIVSDGNHNFDLYIAVNTYSTLNLSISYAIRPINSTVTLTNTPSYSTAYLVHSSGQNTNTNTGGMATGTGPTAY